MSYVKKLYILIFFIYAFNFAGCKSLRTDMGSENPPCCVLPESMTGIKAGYRPETFAEAGFKLPASAQDIDYLGLDVSMPGFRLSQISASVLIVEVFTSYCPYCQEGTEKLNDLYSLIRDQGLEQEIKMIGIGMASFEAEVERFAQKNKVRFPLFADPQNKMYYIVGRKKTPYLAVLQKTENNEFQLILEQEEQLWSAEDLLKSIREKTGL